MNTIQIMMCKENEAIKNAIFQIPLLYRYLLYK
jgi:hypothetical protein